MSRAEHIEWAKQRAMEYVERGDLSGAIGSMLSDLTKHPDTERLLLTAQVLGAWELIHGDRRSVTNFIKGFI